MLKDFIRYFSIGIINTIIHWVIFAFIFYLVYPSQAVSNVVGFFAAVTCSFFLNAKYTFQANPTMIRYVFFLCFMGSLNFIVGWAAQIIDVLPIMTMLFSSGVSLILGFLYSKFFVFSKN
ncbi:MAG TPA: translocase [Pasteurellaceae bacterium]|nr:translocase [Pasteurellaceae bacterium]